MTTSQQRTGGALIVVEGLFWVGLIALAAAGMSGTLIVLGALALVIPGAILYLAPTVLLYALLAQIPRFAWRRTRSIGGVLSAAVVALGLAATPALIVNTQLARQAREIRATNFGSVAVRPEMRTVGLVTPRGGGCADDCRQLLTSGAVDAVAIPADRRTNPGRGLGSASVYKIASGADCARAQGMTPPVDGGASCVLRSIVAEPRVDALLVLESAAVGARWDASTANRLNPFALGRRGRTTLELWVCRAPNVCRLEGRRATMRYERLWPLLFLGSDLSDYELHVNRAWARSEAGDRAPTLGDAFERRPDAPSAGRGSGLKEVQNIASIGATAKSARAGAQDVLLALNAQEEPASAAQIAFIRKLLEGDPKVHLAVDWDRHPEAAAALADSLGPALDKTGQVQSYMEQSIQRAISVLPAAEYRRVGPSLVRWMSRDWALTNRNQPAFLLRLSDLGAAAAGPLTTMAAPDPKYLDAHSDTDEVAAVATALCVLGPKAKASLPRLRERQARVKARAGFENAFTRRLDLAIARIESGGPAAACFENPDDSVSIDPDWLEAFRQQRGLL